MVDEVEFMTRSQLKAKVRELRAKNSQAKDLIEEWVSQQGHNQCWYYPDLYRKLAALLEIKGADPNLPPLSEFKEGCIKYQHEIYGLGQNLCLPDPDLMDQILEAE
jgi:hypothetical protein